jgi:hypothetical protein
LPFQPAIAVLLCVSTKQLFCLELAIGLEPTTC